MEGFLLDTNIVIGVLNGTIDPSLLGDQIFLSAVTVMELYALSGMGIHEEQMVDRAVTQSVVLPITAAIARRAGILARTHRRGKPDLIIAATALVHDLTLFTKNIRDYRAIPSLRVKLF